MTDKECLEEIKKHLENTIIKLGRSNGKTQFLNDLNWLVQQAEKVEELTKRIEEQQLDIKALSQDVNRLSTESGKQYTKLFEIKEILNR